MVTLNDDFWTGVAVTLGVEMLLFMLWITIDMFVLMRIRRYRHERVLQAQAEFEAERELLKLEIREAVQEILGEPEESEDGEDVQPAHD